MLRRRRLRGLARTAGGGCGGLLERLGGRFEREKDGGVTVLVITRRAQQTRKRRKYGEPHYHVDGGGLRQA